MSLFENALAFAAASAPAQANAAPSPIVSMFPIFLIFFVFYFLVFRPQKLKQKQHEETISKLGKNDEIITTGGVHGTIVGLKDNTVMVRIDDNVKIEVERTAILRVKKSRAKDNE